MEAFSNVASQAEALVGPPVHSLGLVWKIIIAPAAAQTQYDFFRFLETTFEN
jgi:hypothetical protein